MNKEMQVTNKLLKKNFDIQGFDAALEIVMKKEEDFFEDTFFTTKTIFTDKLNRLALAIEADADLYSIALEASKSGSIIESLASGAIGSIKKNYEKNRKLLVNYFAFFLKLKQK